MNFFLYVSIRLTKISKNQCIHLSPHHHGFFVICRISPAKQILCVLKHFYVNDLLIFSLLQHEMQLRKKVDNRHILDAELHGEKSAADCIHIFSIQLCTLQSVQMQTIPGTQYLNCALFSLYLVSLYT